MWLTMKKFCEWDLKVLIVFCKYLLFLISSWLLILTIEEILSYFCLYINRKFDHPFIKGNKFLEPAMFGNLMANPKFTHLREQGNFFFYLYLYREFQNCHSICKSSWQLHMYFIYSQPMTAFYFIWSFRNHKQTNPFLQMSFTIQREKKEMIDVIYVHSLLSFLLIYTDL